MRPKGISKFVASLAVCGFLLGVSAASAVPDHPGKPKGKSGPIQDKQSFLASLAGSETDAGGYCESQCCYAWFEGCSGGSADCSNEGCSWSCDGVGGGYYPCDTK